MKNCLQGAKKVIFTAFHSGKLKLTFTSPNIISTSPKNVLMSRLISQFFCNLNSSKKFTCPLGKLITKFTSPIAKSTSPGLSDTTFFARCVRLTSFQKPLLKSVLIFFKVAFFCILCVVYALLCFERLIVLDEFTVTAPLKTVD